MAELKRRCLSCMKEYIVPPGSENGDSICPYCGFIEGSRPKIIYHLYPGTVLQNRYVIGTVLGSGGFGVTYKAWDNVLGIVVAIKENYPTQFVQRVPGTKDVIVYSGEKKDDYENSLNAFLEEARNMAKFDHPNIVHVDNFFEENNTAYIVMEYLDGITLKNYLKVNGGKLGIDDIDYVFLPVMEGLKAIHKNNIIHRDISPDNIMLLNQGGVKLFDFGAAKFSDNEREKTREIILKPGYAPPEQYQSLSVQGSWTDVYALAATLYVALTGKVPTESVNRLPEEFVKNKDLLEEPQKLEPSIPDYLNATILKGMAIEPKLRFRTVEEFERAYKRIKKPPLTPTQERHRKLIKRTISIAVVVLILCAGALFAIDLYKKKDEGKLNAATIEVWYPYSSDMTEDEAKAYGESLFSYFLEQKIAEDVKINLVPIPEDQYIESLEKASKTKKMPALFVSTDAGEEIMKKTSDLKGVFDEYDSSDCRFIRKYEAEIMKSKKLPMGYYLPVLYVRRMNDVDINNVTISSVEDLKKHKGFVADNRYIDITAKTLSASQKEIKDNSADYDKALQDFFDGKVTYYLASTKEYKSIYKNTQMSGNCEMHIYSTDTVYGCFDEYWSIGAGISGDERDAAEMALRYMLFSNVQQQLYVGDEIIMPLNNSTFKDKFVGVVFTRFEIVRDIADKVDLSMSFDK